MKNFLITTILVCSFTFLSAQSKMNTSTSEPNYNMYLKDAMIYWESFERVEFPPTDW